MDLSKSLLEVAKIKSALFKVVEKQYAEKQWNLKLTLMYLTLSPKYKLDDNHETNFDTFEFLFRKL